jgi:hypothetical protein
MTRNQVVAVGAASVLLALGVWAFTRKPAEKPMGERIGEAAVDAVATIANAGIGAAKGAANAISGKLWPVAACAAAMRDGDVLKASWECRPATFVHWIAAGRPRNVSVLDDGSIYAGAQDKSKSKSKRRGASGTWFTQWATQVSGVDRIRWGANVSEGEA